MTTDHTIIEQEDGGLVAAEYVLGVLGAQERYEVGRRLVREPALAAEVMFWEHRLASFADAVKPVAPPTRTWSRIERAITAEIAAAHAPLRRPTLWRSLPFWRGLSAVTTALAAASIAAVAVVGRVPERAPLLATLGGSAGQPNFVASVTAEGNSLVIVPAALLTKDPHSYELWLIPSGETRPRSLGLIQPGQPVRLDVPRGLAAGIARDATLAVSLEPPGGSPTGQPTGPVIANGRLTSL